TSCHGESESHMNKPEGATERPRPERLFRGPHMSDVATRNGACLSCHEGGLRTLWQGSRHEADGVACSSCHQVHAPRDKVIAKATQPEVCFACHKTERAQTQRFSHHPITEGKVVCSECHNPHGSIGPKMLVKATV